MLADPDMRAMRGGDAQLARASRRWKKDQIMLLPKDPNDEKN